MTPNPFELSHFRFNMTPVHDHFEGPQPARQRLETGPLGRSIMRFTWIGSMATATAFTISEVSSIGQFWHMAMRDAPELAVLVCACLSAGALAALVIESQLSYRYA